METKFLFPNRYKKIGWIFFIISALLWVYVTVTESEFSFLQTKTFAIAANEFFDKDKFFCMVDVNLTYSLIGVLFIIGSLLIVFSKEKVEDEFIMKLRLSSFQWAVLVNYLLLLFLFLFVYGASFLTVMVYNMFSVIILYIVRFNYLLLKNRS